MAWFRKDKTEDEQKKGERRNMSHAPSSGPARFLLSISRPIVAMLQALFWLCVWPALALLAVAVAVGVSYFIAPEALESAVLAVSRVLSDAVYAIDIKTGWFSNELPKVIEGGFTAYLMGLTKGFYWKIATLFMVLIMVFVGASYVRHLRRSASLLTLVVFLGIFVAYYKTIDPIATPPTYGSQLKDFQLKETSYVTDRTGNTEIGCFAHENRDVIPLSEISPNLLSAIMASEDHAFWTHNGFNLYAIARAGLANAIKAKIASGASTLTMQLTKNVFLTPERTLMRKVREVVIAVHLEHSVPKDVILYNYVNLVYFGGVYGVKAASKSYFGKSAKEVNIVEAAFLAALINQPEAYRLGGEEGKKKIMARQLRVINLMAEHGYITRAQAEEARNTPIFPKSYSGTCKRTHEYIGAAVNREYGIKAKIPIASAGLNIQTTIDLVKQKKLEESCASTLANYLKRRPENTETIQCSSVAVDIKTGEVLAMVGGQGFRKNQFDNAMQSVRQAGSSFKPFLYASYLEKIYNEEINDRKARCEVTPDECAVIMAEPINILERCKVLDAPVLVPQVVGWKNRIVSRHLINNYPYKGRSQHRGMISCALGLGESRNTATIWAEGELAPAGFGELERWNYGAKTVVDMAHRLGVKSVLQHKNVTGNTPEERASILPNYTIAIGSAEVTLWEMASAFLPLINGGCKQEISLFKRATDARGRVLYEHSPPKECERVLAPLVAEGTRELLRATVDVKGQRQQGIGPEVLLGTGASLREVFPVGVIGGKTGTSTAPDGESSTENWFCGFTVDYLVCSRINNLNKTGLGNEETGGKNALPVFKKFIADLGLFDPNATLSPIDTSVVWQPTVVSAPAPTLSILPARQ